MNKLSKSPERFSFQKDSYLKRRATEGKTPQNDSDVSDMLDYFLDQETLAAQREQDKKWAENNMEHDLRITEWMLEKVRTDDAYAQNLYAAMCNNTFYKILDENSPDTIDKILHDNIPKWSCSWRYAGGIIADMQEKGDYIDWYCSGIRTQSNEEESVDSIHNKYVSESVITDEIRSDLRKLGWIVKNEDDLL